jgi:signal transduction histidine kinase
LFFFVAILNSDGRDFAAFFAFSIWLTKTIYLAYLLFRNATNLRILILGSARISEGDLENKIPYSTLGSEYKELAVNLNHVSDGMQSALQKQLKSERMKTELITNVSHDIKTPLTNIINYVDLLKNEHTDSEKSKEYLQVLDKQSSRLKKLIEDLIETSKAASGNISTNPLSTNLGILPTQSVGEYKDRLEASRLEVLVTLPQADLYAYCDPRLTWRAFDNLLSNVGKYSMAGTRVYISAEETEKAARIIFKNISKDQLNVSPDELTERFVRGDRARNTEGSGLGLSIAKSLTELQQGSLEIAVDGDMFKATVRLPKE